MLYYMQVFKTPMHRTTIILIQQQYTILKNEIQIYSFENLKIIPITIKISFNYNYH